MWEGYEISDKTFRDTCSSVLDVPFKTEQALSMEIQKAGCKDEHKARQDMFESYRKLKAMKGSSVQSAPDGRERYGGKDLSDADE
jgi:hypothetical protein